MSGGLFSPGEYSDRITESVSSILGGTQLPDGVFNEIVSIICQEFPVGGDPSVVRARMDALVRLGIAGSLDVDAENFEFFVNATTGNDANPGTAALPLKTFDKAISLLPTTFWGGKCRIRLDVGAYTMGRGGYSFAGPIGPLAEPLFIIGTMIDSGLGTLTDAGGSTSIVVTGGAGMVVDAFRGQRIRYLTGARAGQTRGVVSNTATAFTLQFALTGGAPGAGDTFVVEKPGTTLTPTSEPTFSVASMGGRVPMPSIAFYAIQFSLTNRSMFFEGGGTYVGWDACWANFNATNTSIIFVTNGAIAGMRGLGVEFPDVSNSSGAVIDSTFFYLFNGVTNATTGVQLSGGVNQASVTAAQNRFFLSLIMDNCFLGGLGAQVTLSGPSFRATQIHFTADSVVTLRSNGKFDGLNLTTVALLVLSGNSTLRMVSGGTYEFSNCTADAIIVSDGSKLGVSGLGEAGTAAPLTLTGTGNVGFGIRLKAGCLAVLGVGTTVTGTAGDIIVGATTTTHANLTAATFVTDANFLSRVSRT